MVDLLIKSGANVNIVDKEGQTVLHTAAAFGNLLEFVKLSLSKAQVQQENKFILCIFSEREHHRVIDKKWGECYA